MARTPDLAAAEQFIWANARLLERHRYAFLFKGGSAQAVLESLGPYRNPDGGFGQALEPDARGSESQPGHVSAAFAVLLEIGEAAPELVGPAFDYLATVTTANGAVPFGLPSIGLAPRAPWVAVPETGAQGGLLPTAAMAGFAHRFGIDHPWVESASRYCVQEIERLETTHPYEVDFCLTFLEHAPDRAWAEAQIERLGQLVRDQRLVELALHPGSATPAPGYALGEVHTALDYAPSPESPARRWFSQEEIDTALDALASGQRFDGGWMFSFREWNQATTIAWRGLVTLGALKTLRAYGRI